MDSTIELLQLKMQELEEENVELKEEIKKLKEEIKKLKDQLDPLKYIDPLDGPALGGFHGDW